MSLYQCAKCGCCENTALSTGAHPYFQNHQSEKSGSEAAFASARERVGLKLGESFGAYCSACTPFWYTEAGAYGIGPNPSPDQRKGDGVWHGKFPQTFYPLGTMETGPDGNLRPIGEVKPKKLKKLSSASEGYIHMNRAARRHAKRKSALGKDRP